MKRGHSTNTRQHQRRCGFSAIEALIVVATALILVALGLAARQLTRARAVMHPPSCVNNLKQVGLAFLMFKNDH